MKIVVFGANGRTGRHVVEYAKNRGHSVRAFVRSSNHLKFDGSKVDVVEGNVNNFSDVRSAVDMQDAIISVIGHKRRVDPDMQTKAMYHVIGASHRDASPNRIISLTGTAVRLKGDKFSLVDKLFNLAMRLIDYTRISDGIQHANVLGHSDLDWTIVRVLKLTNGRMKSKHSLKEHGPPKIFVSRRDTANVLVKLAERGAYSQRAPIIGRRK